MLFLILFWLGSMILNIYFLIKVYGYIELVDLFLIPFCPILWIFMLGYIYDSDKPIILWRKK